MSGPVDTVSGVHEIVRKLSKPHYVFRPRQLLRRRGASSPALLPWNLPLSYEPTGFLGESLARTGVYDLVVSETIWRLVNPGDHVVDAGANIGYMTSIMARRVGPQGRVDAFEPHPNTFRQLQRNVERWRVPVTVHNLALAETPGMVQLFTVNDNDSNQIRASLSPLPDSGESQSVSAAKLDDVLRGPVRLIKIDIEGSELPALRGARRLLDDVIHIVYEDHDPQPSALTRFLERAGFTPLMLEERLWGPKAHEDVTRSRAFGWDAPSLLATRSIQEAYQRLRPRGWRCLSPLARW
jgi:FkbM family methyltransferase